MAAFTTTISFANGDQVTSDKLNEIIGGASFDPGAVADTTITVVGGQIKLGTVTASNMGVNSVATASIQNNAITEGKVLDGAITTNKLGNLAVNSDKLGNSAVTLPKISSSAVATKSQAESGLPNYLLTSQVASNILGAAKAWVEFGIGGAGRTASSFFNVDALTRLSNTQTQVFFDENMNGAEYDVQVTGGSDGTETIDASYYDKLAGSVKIRHTAEGTGRRISVTIYGRYA